jgi:RHS repeat-associated protein
MYSQVDLAGQRWIFSALSCFFFGQFLVQRVYQPHGLVDARGLLTQEKDSAQYLATMEAAYRATENALFYNIDSVCVARTSVPAYPDDVSVTNPNDSIALLDGNLHKQGPAIILKVMAGDKLTVGVQYYFASGSQTANTPISANNLLNSLASGLATLSSAAEEGISTLSNTTTSPLLAALSSGISNDTGTVTTRPQAYLNWISLDNQFNYVANSGGNNQSSAVQVQNAGLNGTALWPALAEQITVTKSGYLYIYVSNSTPGWNVYFDNLSIVHYSSPLIEENHYYPFELAMAGISDKAIKSQYAENRYRYNGKELQHQEFADGTGWEEYDYGARFQDPQLGRWSVIDLEANKYSNETPYGYAGNNPISYVDIGGNFKYPLNKAAEYSQKYKTLTNYLSNGGIQELLKSKSIVNAFKKYGDIDIEKLREEFKWNSGTEIQIVDAPGKGVGGDENTRGYTDMHIEINRKLADLLESADGDDKQAALFLIISTLLHEENHRGNELSGMDYQPGPNEDRDPGSNFFYEIYGKYANPDDRVKYDVDFSDADWKQKILSGAKGIIKSLHAQNKDENLPKTSSAEFNAWLREALIVNPNIKVYNGPIE